MPDPFDEIPCCTPGCSETVERARARLFRPGRAPCLRCGETSARMQSAAKARSVVTLHKGASVYVSPTAAGREFVRHVAQMRRGTNGE